MHSPTVAPYGSWKSPITADLIAGKTISLGQIALDGDDTYWIESRPAEAGRYTLVHLRDGATEEVVPAPFNVRTRVHEYGGGAYLVHRGTIYFSNFRDQRLYRISGAGEPTPITPETGAKLRYADAVMDARRNRLICVREDHTPTDREPVNTIAAVAADGDAAGGYVLVAGHDFYAAPRLSPDGMRLAWLAWNHPNMPWDGTELWLADVTDDGTLANQRLIAGGPRESIFQPEWSPAGVLHFVSDRTGWWNLYRWRDGEIQALHPMDAEFGKPQWVFGQSTYAFVTPTRIACAYAQNGVEHLALLDTDSGAWREIASPYTAIGGVRADGRRVVFNAGAPTEFASIVRLDLASGAFTTLKRASDLQIDPGYISVAQPVEFPTEGGLTAYAFFYPPRNRDFVAPEGERPPLLVMSHGGPTGATGSALSLKIQYWTSRGIAVLDVNYGGSTGYGRAYRERLNGQWGVVDVDDCVNGARYLAQQGLVDGARLMITGGSAGGYTTLCALTFRDVFKAGASHFGVSDAEALARDTHKFESRYLDNLIGPYPERRDLYVQRSPVHFAHRINAPLILLQGLEDVIVPPSQSEAMFAAVRAKGLPAAYVTFEGEQHGFRKAENIKRALEAELYFYGRVFGFTPADPIEPVRIENMD
ncbi:MAG: S9 family peptidase [Anaerolineae bacterium]|nr:S9 family peptidase [Candidatus Roseilinea sp.]MDW8450493.1 S9 family peptidase [Anaerolineae bacterium]